MTVSPMARSAAGDGALMKTKLPGTNLARIVGLVGPTT